MKGTARPDSLTGKIQRALTDEWQTQAQITAKAGIYESRPSTVRALLERLCSEGRAEWQRRERYGKVIDLRWRKVGNDG